ncbi:nucleotide sugar dehydrogenase [bacterium]|nr:nucleotide sugar dehydrogenase [bacterium]
MIKKRICTIGLGYVGLPLTLSLAKHFEVIGYDNNETRISELMTDRSRSSKTHPQLKFTSEISDCEAAQVYIVAVPTPVDEAKQPDFTALEKASEAAASVLQVGDIVIYESTVYPGATEEICVPILEKFSGLKYIIDFGVGYSPERINPGDTVNTLENCVKIVSASDSNTLDVVKAIYDTVVHAGLYPVSDIRTAEAAKIIENTQRDVNIALFNELSQIFNLLRIDSKEVFDAAASKWNFHRYTPGLVGGHCIGVDPYYLTKKALEIGFNPQIILAGRKINDNMVTYVYDQIIDLVVDKKFNLGDVRALVIGSTFKENCPDTRNSKSLELIDKLSQKFSTDVFDPVADYQSLPDHIKTMTIGKLNKRTYDIIVISVAHSQIIESVDSILELKRNKDSIIIDLKNILPKEETDFRL